MVALAAGKPAEIVDNQHRVQHVRSSGDIESPIPDGDGGKRQERPGSQRSIRRERETSCKTVAPDEPAAEDGNRQNKPDQSLGHDPAGRGGGKKKQKENLPPYRSGLRPKIKRKNRQQDAEGEQHIHHALPAVPEKLRTGHQHDAAAERTPRRQPESPGEQIDDQPAAERRQRRRQLRRPVVYAETRIGSGGAPVIERRILEKRLPVQPRNQIIPLEIHLGGDAGHPGLISALEFADTQPRKRNQNPEQKRQRKRLTPAQCK